MPGAITKTFGSILKILIFRPHSTNFRTFPDFFHLLLNQPKKLFFFFVFYMIILIRLFYLWPLRFGKLCKNFKSVQIQTEYHQEHFPATMTQGTRSKWSFWTQIPYKCRFWIFWIFFGSFQPRKIRLSYSYTPCASENFAKTLKLPLDARSNHQNDSEHFKNFDFSTLLNQF